MSPSRQSSGEAHVISLSREPFLTINGSRTRYLLAVTAVAALYFAAAKFGLSLASVHTNVSPVWPPTGIALAAALLFGFRIWPGIFIGALLANLTTPVSGGIAIGIAAGNTLEAVVAAAALKFFQFRNSLDRARDVFKFVVTTAICTMIAATIGNLSLCLGNAASWSAFTSLWMTWWLGDLTGAVTLVPLILTWATAGDHWLPRRRYLEATLLVLLLSISSIVTFGGTAPVSVQYYPLSRLMVPFLLWAAFRLGRRGVTVAIPVVSAFAIWGTSHGFGPFIGDTSNESLLMLQLFIATNAVTFLFLVTVVEEKRFSEQKRRQDQQRLEANLAITQILAESPEAGVALQRILATVGDTLGWEFGCAWVPTADGKMLRSVATWRADEKAARFEALCRERTFERGVGLPGRIWTTQAPAWIRDVAKDGNFPRASVAIADGLHSAFGFPIMFKGEFVGVMEFFSSHIREPHKPLLAMFAGIGSQIGQFIERKEAESVMAEIARQQSALFVFADKAQHAAVPSDVYAAGLEAILAALQCDRASILIYDDSQVMQFVGWHGLSDEYRKAVEGHSPWQPDNPNPQPVCIADIETSDLSEELKRTILKEGIRSAAFIPLVAGGRLIGKFMTYYNEPHEYRPAEMNLGFTLARQLANGIDSKRAAEALRENESRLRLATTAGKVGVWDWDIAADRVSWTDSLYQIHGVSKDDFAGTVEAFSNLVHPDDRERVQAAIEESLRTGAPYQTEMRTVRPDGEVVWIYTSATVLREDEKPVRMLGATVDISDIKRTEHALSESEKELTEFFENAGEAIHWVGPDGTILRANKAELNMLGYAAEEYIGRNIAEFHIDQANIDDIMTRLRGGEVLTNWASQMIAKNGSVRDVLINSSVYFKNGEFIHTRCFTRDVTNQIRTEKDLRHMAAIVETTDDAVISKDLNGIITSWNPAAESLYGYKAEEAIGRPVTILIPPERPDEEPAILERLRRGQRIDHYETIRIAKDGRRLHVSLTVSPIRNAQGKIIGASKIARDITLQKQHLDEIARLLVAERAARQDAEVASRTKDEFLATLSHELRTPLTAMLGWLTILRAHKIDKKTTEHAIDTIERNAKAQAQLIEDLVDISRIVGGKLSLEVLATELLPVINAAIEVVQPAANAKEISISVNYDATVGPVSGDAGRLQQIIWNLLSNAVKFTPNGGSVFIDFRRSGNFAEVEVRDNGTGIALDFLPHVFERFRQGETSATRTHRGMGLGLAIVRHLVELHGGTISAASDGENRGSTFTIHLPLAAATRAAATATFSRKTNGENRHDLKGLRVLLVEDEPDARELIAMLLKGSGADVEAVDSVGSALQRLPLFLPDVLLSDIGLPRESGYDLIRRVRSLASDVKKVPAIALTAFATENDRKQSLSAGFQAHLAKPVEPAHLLKTIKSVINGKK
jgi:PAS domain S-box-containing protein